MASPASALSSVAGYLPASQEPKSFMGTFWDVAIPVAVGVAIFGTGMPEGIVHWLVIAALGFLALGMLFNLFTVQF